MTAPPRGANDGMTGTPEMLGGVSAGWDCHVHVFGAGGVASGAHYVPVPRPLAQIEAVAQAHGAGHLVLVQPSVYGADNSLLLEGLRASRGRHRGVVVLDDAQADAARLRDWHEAGVRGVRFNLVSPVGTARADALRQMRERAPLLRALGWHAQWYARAQDLADLAALQEDTGVPFVLDHLAGLTAAHLGDPAAWQAAQRLAAGGAWIKLSGWYRLRSAEPYADLVPVVGRVGQVFAGRMVWGSDWPHTSFAPAALPPYASTWTPVAEALGEERAQHALAAGAVLYA